MTSSAAFLPGQRTSEIGVWESTGPQTYRSVREAYILFDGGLFQKGAERITETIQVNGDQTTHVNTAEFYDEDGNLLRSGCSMAVGERFQMRLGLHRALNETERSGCPK